MSQSVPQAIQLAKIVLKAIDAKFESDTLVNVYRTVSGDYVLSDHLNYGTVDDVVWFMLHGEIMLSMGTKIPYVRVGLCLATPDGQITLLEGE